MLLSNKLRHNPEVEEEVVEQAMVLLEPKLLPG